MEDQGWVEREIVDAYAERDGGHQRAQAPRPLSVRLSSEERTLLEEAMALTKTGDPQEVVRLALKELVERQRFLNWVAAHEREGSA